MIEDRLGESLTTGGLTKISGETEGLGNGQVSLDNVHGGTGALLLTNGVAATLVQNTVDTTHGLLRAGNLDQVDGLHETGLGDVGGGVDGAAAGGDDLSTTAMDGISVENNIQDVEAASAHVLLGEDTLAGGPLEGSNAGILDFVQVGNSLGQINHKVSAVGIGTESPDLTGLLVVPLELVGEDTGTGLELITGTDLAVLDGEGELLTERGGLHEDTVVLVGGLGKSSDGRLGLDGLLVLDDGVGLADGDLGVVLLEILQANLEMELSGTGNNVLTGLGSEAENARVGLGETLETLDQLGEIGSLLALDGDLDDGGDRELHDLQVVGSIGGGDGTRLEQELINTDQTDNVTGRAVLDGLDVTTHHENNTLDRLDEQVGLGADLVVGALDADLKTSADGTGEDTTESVETTLVGGGDHLGDVQHERTVGVASSDTLGALIVLGTLVQVLDTVLLGGDGGRQVDNNHLQESLTSGQELLHDGLEQHLALHLLLVVLEGNVELVQHGEGGILLEVHDGIEELEDGVQDEHVEGTLEGLAVGIGGLGGPLLGGGVEVVLTPELVHHLGAVNTELLGVALSELTDGEGPSVETGSEGDGALLGVNHDITENLVVVGGDDDVDGLDGTLEGGVEILLGDLQLEKSTIDLVDDNNGLDALTQSLTQDSLGLDTDTVNAVDDDEGTISDTESSGNLGREVNVPGGIDQVDQERGTLRTQKKIGDENKYKCSLVAVSHHPQMMKR